MLTIKVLLKKCDVRLGSPLGPTLANIFLSHHETIWLDNYPPSFSPLLYRRYVDDTFLIFKNQSHITFFQNEGILSIEPTSPL